MIIAFAGRKQAGKDAAVQYLVDNYDYERVAFADKLKDSVAALFDITREEIEVWKMDPNTMIEIVEYADESRDPIYAFVKSFTFREFLQRYGTEAHREIFGHNFWINEAFNDFGDIEKDKIAISDMRFHSEFAAVRRMKGRCVFINRPGVDELDMHASEQELVMSFDGWDAIINNDSTLKHFFNQIDELVAQ